ncbi:MAG TPA: helix-hairpin-helix domain-containing protein [Microvirga sp.]|jgi:hypothetical protein|nr:helix-hairpin-helix domain-containing protein [Microvirga sp.]
MRTSLIPSPRTPFDRLTSILVRVLSLIGIVGLLVVVLHSLPGEKGKAASVSAAPNGTATEPARTASAAPAQAATPRIVSTSPGAAPNAVPAPVQPQPVAALPPNPAPPVASPAAPAPVAVAAPLPKPVSATPPVPAAQPAPTRTASIETKPEPAPSAAGRLVDLNTASVEELNKLNGARMIGRSVIKGRPYASPEDLLTKRILNRSTYDRIKDQITVR